MSAGVRSPTEVVWLRQFLTPLIRLRLYGEPIVDIEPRQYGVVAFLLMDPAILIFGDEVAGLDVWAVSICVLSIVVSYVIVAWRFFPLVEQRILLGALWFSFMPIVYATALRHIDAWQLLFLTIGWIAYVGWEKGRSWGGVPLAAGFLSKLLPVMMIGFVGLRSRAMFVAGGASVLVLLGIGHLLYGPLMGFLYPVEIARQAPGLTLYFSQHHENNSVRGLLFKTVAGFHLATADEVHPPFPVVLNVLAYGLQFGLIVYLGYVWFRGRRDASIERRTFEYALAVLTMMMVAPQTSHEHMPPLAIVFAALAFLHLRAAGGGLRRAPMLLALVGVVLVGLFLPVSVLARLLLVPQLFALAGNSGTAIDGSLIGMYDFLGFPGFGMVLTWCAMFLLERQFSASSDGIRHDGPPATGSSDRTAHERDLTPTATQ